MRLYRNALALCAATLLWLAAPPAHAGVTISNIFLFQGSALDPNGRHPSSGLIRGTDGNFYGTTGQQGFTNSGTIFQLTPAGQITTLGILRNTNGADPFGELVQGTNGSLYGTASEGGVGNYGTIYEVTTNGVLSVLDMFNGTNGAAPYGGLLPGADGNFYGMTSAGGTDGYLPNPTGVTNGYGTVFKMTPAGVLTTIASFHGTNGATPYGALVEDTNGNFYGTTTAGGASGNGVVFELAAGNGAVSALVSFDYTNSGASPVAGLVQGTDGNYYGMTSTGGTNSVGTVFRVTPAGALTTLVSFDTVNGYSPAYGALIQGRDGNFYGTTQLGGTNNAGNVFQMTLSGKVTSLVSFDGVVLGSYPVAGLLETAPGSFLGTTSDGAAANGGGTVFRLIVPPAPRFMAYGRSGNSFMLSWSTVTNQKYQLQYKTDLTQGIWNNLGVAIPCTNSTSTVYDPLVPGPGRVYRVEQLP
jgi:uncharacterized repeat protein (TIGR03803 family)